MTKRFFANGIHLSAEVRQTQISERATPIVLLAGTGETSSSWADVAERLEETRTVYSLNLRGHGGSDWPGTYSLHVMADDVQAFLHELGEPVDVVGHSLGGLVALLVAAREPQLVRRLVLEDVGSLRPREPSALTKPDVQLDFDWGVVEQVRPEIDQPATHWPTTASAVPLPTLVIGGGPKSFVPQDAVRMLVELLPQGNHVVIDAGHHVHREEPQRFVAIVEDFLSQ